MTTTPISSATLTLRRCTSASRRKAGAAMLQITSIVRRLLINMLTAHQNVYGDDMFFERVANLCVEAFPLLKKSEHDEDLLHEQVEAPVALKAICRRKLMNGFINLRAHPPVSLLICLSHA
eukprot:1442363-Pleurochrysis_carterae.AAC.1